MPFDTLAVKKVSSEATLPTRAHPEDAGLDLYCLEDVLMEPGQGKMAKTGIAVALEVGYVGLIADRSSLAKKGIKTAGGVIDAGYRGEIQVILWNLSRETLQIKKGERLAQLLILPIVTPQPTEAAQLEDTDRGDKGFGSSGK